MDKSDQTIRKYTETYGVDDYEVLSDEGFVDVKSVSVTVEYDKWRVETEGHSLECADTHILFRADMSEVYACELLPGDLIITNAGMEKVVSVYNTGEIEQMCDMEVAGKNRFYTNGMLSHNSLVLANLAVRSALSGANVGIFTVELGDRKYVKRVGSNLFNIPYTMYSKFIDEDNLEPVNAAIAEFKRTHPNAGQLIIKEYPTGGASSIDIENYFIQLEHELKIHFDVIFVDYINLLKPSRSKGDDSLYSKIKAIAEELRRIAKRNMWCVVSATQVKAQYFNSDELYLDSAAESSGLVATVDSLFGLTGDPGSPRLKMKNLANRDEGHMDSYKHYLKVKEYFRLTEDSAADSEYWSDEGGEELEKAIRNEYLQIPQPNNPDFSISGAPMQQMPEIAAEQTYDPRAGIKPNVSMDEIKPASQVATEQPKLPKDIDYTTLLNGI